MFALGHDPCRFACGIGVRPFGIGIDRKAKRLRHGLAQIERHRGAFVARPSMQDAMEIYDALTLVEQGVAAQLSDRLGPAGWAGAGSAGGSTLSVWAATGRGMPPTSWRLT